MSTPEVVRLQAAQTAKIPWRKWGPYLSERQWGTVREDYSQNGDAWNYFSHDQARARAYHWGEDGLAGISDEKQLLCFSLGLWNHKDPILKERLFELTNRESNHGEDVKEYYFYLDSTPTHSYMKLALATMRNLTHDLYRKEAMRQPSQNIGFNSVQCRRSSGCSRPTVVFCISRAHWCWFSRTLHAGLESTILRGVLEN
jgi:hypothetical protein